MFTSVLHSNGRDAALTTRKTPFPLLLRNRHAYRGVAYKLPEQILYSIIRIQSLRNSNSLNNFIEIK
jgi:hypothetical protein